MEKERSEWVRWDVMKNIFPLLHYYASNVFNQNNFLSLFFFLFLAMILNWAYKKYVLEGTMYTKQWQYQQRQNFRVLVCLETRSTAPNRIFFFAHYFFFFVRDCMKMIIASRNKWEEFLLLVREQNEFCDCCYNIIAMMMTMMMILPLTMC